MTKSKSPLGSALSHESAHLHVSGEARYVDDFPLVPGLLHAQIVPSPVAAGLLKNIDVTPARAVPGVVDVLVAADIPGANDASPVFHDEPFLAPDEIHSYGQSVCVVVAESVDACRVGASKVHIDIEESEPILSIQDAIEKDSFQGDVARIGHGDVDRALNESEIRFSGEIETGGQDHFYLESQIAQVTPLEDGCYQVESSTQHPSEVQTKIAELLGIGRHRIVVRCPRMGGGFGGKESQAVYVAQAAALAAWKTGRPVRMRMNRDQDMISTGKRHPWFSTYEAGFSKEGDLQALRVKTYADGGWSLDLSPAILQRCLFHLDNSYFIPNADFEGRIAKTNKTSNTAFRGFGGPQGMAVVEAVMNHAAQLLGVDAAKLRARNFYGAAPRNQTPYGQEVIFDDNRLERLYAQLMSESDYEKRRRSIESFNASSKWVKRGIGFQPVKFGISFTTSMLNQAGALLLVYADGSVQLNHGGTEMGQGLHTKMLAICAHELGADLEQVRIMPTSTDKVPNTSATAASSGSDLNGQAVRNACVEVRERMRPIAAQLLGVVGGDADTIVFAGGKVYLPGQEDKAVTFGEVTQASYVERISLSATGYYRTPNIYFDAKTGKGRPFHYYAYGGSVVEIEVNGLTGEHRMRRVDIVHDVGNSLLPEIDKGQVEGGFVQGAGWVTVEELVMDDRGRLLTHAPSTYKIPAYGDIPEDFRVSLLERAPQEGVIHKSKAVGEPPFMHGLAMLTALEHAIGAFGPDGVRVSLSVPATPEAILRSVENSRSLVSSN